MPPDDPLWPRASTWLAGRGDPQPGARRLAVLGVPAERTSLSPTRAGSTPAAVRAALARFSTWSASAGVDLRERVPATDLGDVTDPDEDEGRTAEAVTAALRPPGAADLLVALGGDNSITTAVALGAVGELRTAGLLTLDAHHDLRDGRSNGSPVRRLIEAGLNGHRVVQIGIADHANSRAYAERARDLGITVITARELERRPMADAVAEGLEVAGAGGGAVHVDIDVDVCDRSVAPACPASLPGGLPASALREAALLAARDPRVCSIDIVEVDAAADTPDGRTVRLVALCLLDAAVGLALRPESALIMELLLINFGVQVDQQKFHDQCGPG